MAVLAKGYGSVRLGFRADLQWVCNSLRKGRAILASSRGKFFQAFRRAMRGCAAKFSMLEKPLLNLAFKPRFILELRRKDFFKSSLPLFPLSQFAAIGLNNAPLFFAIFSCKAALRAPENWT